MSDAELANRLDRLIEKLDELAVDVRRHEIALFGKDGDLGIIQQVRVVWRIHVWVLCSFSAAAGSAMTAILSAIWK